MGEKEGKARKGEKEGESGRQTGRQTYQGKKGER